MIKNFILSTLFFLSFSALAQTKKYTEKDYAQKPVWIQLMDIEGVNFNETLKAYDIYWQHHTLPEEEGDRYNGKGAQKKRKISKKELREIQAGAEMRFQLKKFEHWKIKNEPFVKENGNIMTADERIKFQNQNQ